ncbi:TonB-dependent receptor domain-containing protein, partial [Shewanella sp.]
QKGVPYVTASTWVTYAAELDLPAPVSISLGAEYVGQRSTNSSSFGIPDGYVPSYTVFDTAISYDVERYKVQLNINNLLNKSYYEKAMFLGGLPGEERNAKLTVTYRI